MDPHTYSRTPPAKYINSIEPPKKFKKQTPQKSTSKQLSAFMKLQPDVLEERVLGFDCIFTRELVV